MSDAGIKNWLGSPDELTDDEIKNLTGAVMDPKYKTGKNGCNACPLQCGAEYHVKNDTYDIHCSRPEYESLGTFGSMLLNGDSDTAVICNWYCNEYGYDVLSFGGTLAWCMECYEKGVLTRDELDGIDLKWGDKEAILALTKRICDFEGVGVALNRASRGAADYFGKGHDTGGLPAESRSPARFPIKPRPCQNVPYDRRRTSCEGRLGVPKASAAGGQV
jgi:aldehyde:ferredoxin oxidoreductase